MRFQAYAYFSQAICPIPIYTTGCRTSRSRPLVPLPVEKKSVLEEKPISSHIFRLDGFPSCPEARSIVSCSVCLGCIAAPRRSACTRQSLEAEDLKSRLCFLWSLQSLWGGLPQHSPLTNASSKGYNTSFSVLYIQQNYIVIVTITTAKAKIIVTTFYVASPLLSDLCVVAPFILIITWEDGFCYPQFTNKVELLSSVLSLRFEGHRGGHRLIVWRCHRHPLRIPSHDKQKKISRPRRSSDVPQVSAPRPKISLFSCPLCYLG